MLDFPQFAISAAQRSCRVIPCRSLDRAARRAATVAAAAGSATAFVRAMISRVSKRVAQSAHQGRGESCCPRFHGDNVIALGAWFRVGWAVRRLADSRFRGNYGRQSERRRNDSHIEFSVNPPLQAHQCRGDLSLAIRARFRLNGAKERKLQKPMFDKRWGGV